MRKPSEGGSVEKCCEGNGSQLYRQRQKQRQTEEGAAEKYNEKTLCTQYKLKGREIIEN